MLSVTTFEFKPPESFLPRQKALLCNNANQPLMRLFRAIIL